MSSPIDDLWRIHLPRDSGPILKEPRAFIQLPEPPEPPPQVGRWWYCPECGAADTYPENESMVICALHSPMTPRQPLRLTESDWLACKNPEALALMGYHVTGVPLSARTLLATNLPSEVDVRCLFGNPFRPAAVHADCLAWRDGMVRRLAEAALACGEMCLPILADALEEAGCSDDAILRHLREPGQQHWPGCFVLRAILA